VGIFWIFTAGSVLVLQKGTIAEVEIGFARTWVVLFPQSLPRHGSFLRLIFPPHCDQPVRTADCWSVDDHFFLTYLNTRGVKLGQVIQNI